MKTPYTTIYGSIIGLVLLYVGAYLSLVKAEDLSILVGPGPWERIPEYRFGGDVSRTVFSPIQKLDSHVRPRYWQFTIEDWYRPMFTKLRAEHNSRANHTKSDRVRY